MHLRFAALLALLCSAAVVTAEPAFFARPFLLGVHRGGGQWRPEHTLKAYQDVVERWPQALLEMDVRLTKDGVVVLHHDASVDRTTDGTGPIEDLTLAEVRALDAGYDFTPDDGATFPYRGRGLQIATLDEVLGALPEARWLIEPKTDGPLVTEVARLVKAHEAESRVILASFKPAVVEKAKVLMPDVLTCYTMISGMTLLSALRAGGDTWQRYQPDDDILSLSQGMVKQFEITADQIAQVQSKGIKVQVHTLNTAAEIRAALELGVDSILSDRPDILAEVLAEP